MTERMLAAVRNPRTDVLGHCTGRQIKGKSRPQSEFDARRVFDACAENGVAVEINCRPDRLDPPHELLDVAIEAGCLFSIDTDAHAPGQLDWLAAGCERAAQHDLDPARDHHDLAARRPPGTRAQVTRHAPDRLPGPSRVSVSRSSPGSRSPLHARAHLGPHLGPHVPSEQGAHLVSVNRTELVQALAAKAGLTNTDADKALKAFQEVVVENLAKGEAVTIPGFLAVARAERGARTGINPQTGEKLEIPAGFRVKLTAGSALKRAVQG